MMKRLPIFSIILILAGIGLGIFAWDTYENPKITIEWETETELEAAGYHLLRSTTPEDGYQRITTELIPAATDPLVGDSYEYVDATVERGVTYYYQLEEIETSGTINIYGPIDNTANSDWGMLMLTAIAMLGAAWYFYVTEKPAPPTKQVE